MGFCTAGPIRGRMAVPPGIKFGRLPSGRTEFFPESLLYAATRTKMPGFPSGQVRVGPVVTTNCSRQVASHGLPSPYETEDRQKDKTLPEVWRSGPSARALQGLPQAVEEVRLTNGSRSSAGVAERTEFGLRHLKDREFSGFLAFTCALRCAGALVIAGFDLRVWGRAGPIRNRSSKSVFRGTSLPTSPDVVTPQRFR